LDWRAKVEMFEEIRREYEFGVGTIAGVASKLKVHRRMVREAIGCALPRPRKKTERPRWKIAARYLPSSMRCCRRTVRRRGLPAALLGSLRFNGTVRIDQYGNALFGHVDTEAV
jgi:hypothetical protein